MKHGYPNVNNAQPHVNVASQEEFDVGTSSSSGLGASASSNTGFSQYQLDQLVSMLQQENLVVPSPSSSQATSNHIAATPTIPTNISAPEPFAGIPVSSPSSLTQNLPFDLLIQVLMSMFVVIFHVLVPFIELSLFMFPYLIVIPFWLIMTVVFPSLDNFILAMFFIHLSLLLISYLLLNCVSF